MGFREVQILEFPQACVLYQGLSEPHHTQLQKLCQPNNDRRDPYMLPLWLDNRLTLQLYQTLNTIRNKAARG
jgi:hypothetical protein